MRWTGRIVLAAVVLSAACTSGGGQPSAQSPAPSASSPVTAASAKVSVQGDPSLTASFTQPDVRCSFPDVDGPSIALLSTPPGLVFRIRVQQGKVTVLVSDTATPAHERDFVGTGVTTFEPAAGGDVDSTLTEIPSTEGSPDGIGQLTSIKASIDCAGQDPGTSTLTLSGNTPRGPLANAGLETARVECNPSGNEVSVVGLVTVGGAKEFVVLGLHGDEVDINKMVAGGGSEYRSSPGAATVTDTGARVRGDAAEQGGDSSHVLHVEGEATCGTPVS